MRFLWRLSNKFYKKNRTRNLTAVIAIALAAMLTVILFSVTETVKSAINDERSKMTGSMSEGFFPYANSEQYEAIKNIGLFGEIKSIRIEGTYRISDDLSKGSYIYASDEETARLAYNDITEGDWPSDENEIAVPDRWEELVGEKASVGDRFKLYFVTDGSSIEKECLVSGIYKANPFSKDNPIYVSENSSFAGEPVYKVFCSFKSNINEKSVKNIFSDEGIEETVFIKNINSVNKSGNSVWILIGAGLLTVMCSAILIHSVYYISLSNNMQELGQLKLIGMKNVQLKTLFMFQMLRQYGAGYVSGCVAGCMLGVLIVPAIGKSAGVIYDCHLKLRPVYFVYAAVFSFVALMIGTAKTFSIIRKATPIRLSKYTIVNKKKFIHTQRFSVPMFALRNIFIQKKKNTLLVLSVSLTITLFVIISNICSSMDIHGLLGELQLPADIVITQEDAISLLEAGVLPDKTNLPEYIYSDIKNSCTEAKVIAYRVNNTLVYLDDDDAESFCGIIKNGSYLSLDPNTLSKVDKHIKEGADILVNQEVCFYEMSDISQIYLFEGKYDADKFETGKYCFVAALNDEGDSLYHAGDKVRISVQKQDLKNLTSESKKMFYLDNLKTEEYEVMAVVKDAIGHSLNREKVSDITFILPTDEIKAFEDEPKLQAVLVYSDDISYLEKMDSAIEEYLRAEPGISYLSEKVYWKELKDFRSYVRTIGYCFAGIIGALSVINFINCCVSGIVERKEEFTTIRAIGMTRKQLLAILRCENSILVLSGNVLGFLIGHVISRYAILRMEKEISYFKYNPSFASTFILCIGIVVFACLYPNRRTKRVP